MIRFSGINHMAFATGDMDRTVRFWRDLIGMRMVAALGKPGFRQYMFQMSPNDLLVFFEWPGVEPIEEKGHGMPTKGPFGFDHVAIGVEGQDDLFLLKDRLNAAGIWVSEVLDHCFIYSIYTFDPNGIAVEFSCRTGKGADVCRDPILADKAPSAIVREGAEPNLCAWPAVEQPTKEDERKIYEGDFFFME